MQVGVPLIMYLVLFVQLSKMNLMQYYKIFKTEISLLKLREVGGKYEINTSTELIYAERLSKEWMFCQCGAQLIECKMMNAEHGEKTEFFKPLYIPTK